MFFKKKTYVIDRSLEDISKEEGSFCPKCNSYIPQDVPYCNAPPCMVRTIEKIDYPDDGYGIFTYLGRYKFPFKGFPDEKVVDQNATAKRAVIAAIKYFSKSPTRYFLPFFFILPPVWKKKILLNFGKWWSEILETAFRKYYLDPKRYCTSGRELYRVGMKLIQEYNLPYLENLVKGIVMVWEFDNAYRYRGQDILSAINKESLSKNPRKEIMRLLRLGIQRERSVIPKRHRERSKKLTPWLPQAFDVLDKWKLIFRLTSVAMFLSPLTLKIIKTIFDEINPKEMAFDEMDWYYLCERFDYDFGGKTYLERSRERMEIDEEYWKTIPPPAAPKPQIACVPNDEFFKMEQEGAKKLVENLMGQLWQGYAKKHQEWVMQNTAKAN